MDSELIVSIVMIIAGLGCAFWAAPLGPNHWFGIRFSYAMDNKDVWFKVNRLGGKLFIIWGILLCFMSFVLPNRLDHIFMPIAVICILLIVAYTYFYGKKLLDAIDNGENGADIEKLKKEVPLYLQKYRRIYCIFGIVLTAIVIIAGLSLISSMPSEMAVHFTFDGAPDDSMGKWQAVLLPIGLQLILLLFFYFIYSDTMMISLRNALVTLGCFVSCHLAVALVSFDIWMYNVEGYHILKLEWVSFFLPVIIIFPPLVGWWSARRKEKKNKSL